MNSLLVDNFFKNYQSHKLIVGNPEYVNGLLWGLTLFLIVITSREKNTKDFFDHVTTEQVRGLAIIMVIIGHVWVHVAVSRPNVVLSGDGVALFLFLSGYGIALSLSKKPLLKRFLLRRIDRVMIPYWGVTFVILILDAAILSRTYKLVHISATLFGINVYGIMHHFDYVRWYITFLIFWYVAATLIYRTIDDNRRIVAIFVIGFSVFILNYYVLDFGWYQFFAFPIGCLLAEYKSSGDEVLYILRRKSLLIFPLVIIFVSVYVKFYLLAKLSHQLPSILYFGLRDGLGVVIAISTITFINVSNYSSDFLILCGKYSYELFLIHGVFLVKYNPFFHKVLLVPGFVLYFALILILSMVLQKGFKYLRIVR